MRDRSDPQTSHLGPRLPSRSAEPARPTEPPLYDPSQYGYGPANPVAPEPEDDDDLLQIPTQPQTLWLVLGAALVGAAVAAVLAVSVVMLLDDDSTQTRFIATPSVEPGETLDFAGEPLDVQAVLARVQPAVVTIEPDVENSRGLFEGGGSGVIISEDGLIITNAHVVSGADNIDVVFFDGSVHTADLVGSFPDEDIALIKARSVTGLIPAQLGSADAIRVGDEVIAIGNAFNLGGQPTITRGIISAKDRSVQSGLIGLDDLLQTDAAINRGNSGGPLVNAAGEVVGINTAIIDVALNIGFAISIDTVIPLIDDLVAGDAAITPDIAFLGLTTRTLAMVPEAERAAFDVAVETGALVTNVIGGSAAQGAGFAEGDVVTSIDGNAVTASEDVARIVRSKRPGDAVVVEANRAGAVLMVEVTLGVQGN